MQHPGKYFLKRLNSTNLYASEWTSKLEEKEPFWIRTDDQFAGKGQGSHVWISEPEQNITGSLVIFPDRCEAADQFELSKIFAIAASCFLELFVDEIRIKWPNDLYAGDRKVGGILIETAIQGKTVNYAILGIGINVNQIAFPEDLPNPTSLRLLTGFKYNLTEMEDLFLETFLNKYNLIETDRFSEIDEEYTQRLYRLNEPAVFRASGNTFTGKITGVDEFGQLLVETDGGTLHAFSYQEIEYQPINAPIDPVAPSTH